MPVGAILTRPHPAQFTPGLTNQTIADFMLQADRDRRAALRNGDAERAAELDAEMTALASALA